MLSIPGIVLLVVFVYVRPQEIFTSWQAVPLLYVFVALALVGLVLDVRLGFVRIRPTRQLAITAALLLWCIVTVVIKAPWALGDLVRAIAIPATLLLLIACGAQSFRALEVLLATLLALVLFVSFVGVEQGFSAPECHVVDWKQGADVGVPDGRPCTTRRSCEGEGAAAGADYLCEKPGLFGTSSGAGGRVRYRGILQDPNELSLAACAAIPFAFAFFERRRNALRAVVLVVTLVLVGLCTVFSQSRGGQLVFLTAIGVYFVRRFGWRGVLLGAALAVPILLFGGRSGEEADSSADERTMCLYAGMEMFRSSPIFGVGFDQFTEHHQLTAHNSFVLVAAELGVVGMLLWVTLIYLAIKAPIVALVRAGRGQITLAPVARSWAVALAASLASMYVGIFFLSFSYHHVLWISLGLSGSFYAAIRRHEPRFEVELGWREVTALTGACLALLVAITAYAGWRASSI